MENRIYRLRAHHGMCLSFFKGKGYSGEFTKNMSSIKAQLQENPLISLTEGTDDICAACPNNDKGRCKTEEKAGSYDRKVLYSCGLKEGEIMAFGEFKERISRCILQEGKREEICGDCQWSELCRL